MVMETCCQDMSLLVSEDASLSPESLRSPDVLLCPTWSLVLEPLNAVMLWDTQVQKRKELAVSTLWP